MYFKADPPVVENPIDFGDYLEDFDFIKYIYKDKRTVFEELFNRDSAFVADLAGAVFATMARAGYTHKDVYQRTVECSRDIILAEGFNETDADEVKPLLQPDGRPGIPNHVLIAGCQDKEMLNRRVRKGAEFVSKLGSNCVVVFSGGNPDSTKTRKVKIYDESRRMRVHFKEHLLNINADAQLPPMHDLRNEDSSTTTETNIARFFERDFLSRQTQNNLIVVSSTFHLIRVAREIKRQIALPAHKDKIRHLVLVGPEDPSHQFRLQDAGYLKLMMFDVFHYLLRLAHPPVEKGRTEGVTSA